MINLIFLLHFVFFTKYLYNLYLVFVLFLINEIFLFLLRAVNANYYTSFCVIYNLYALCANIRSMSFLLNI